MAIQLFRLFLLFYFFAKSTVEIAAQSNLINSQDDSRFIIKEDGVYLYEGDVYNYEELLPLFKNCHEAMSYRHLSLRKDELVKKSNYMMAASGGLTIILFGLANKQGRGTLGYSKFGNAGIVVLSMNLIVFPYNMIQKLLSSKYKNESIQSFNAQEIMQNGYDRDASHLQFGITGNGIGFVYSF